MSKMTIEEFVAAGYLQEVNRQFLHPLGLALEVTECADGAQYLSGVWDCRDDPEGLVFAQVDKTKAENVARIQAERRPQREQGLGFWIQPEEDP